MVAGDLVNTASRVQSAAEPGTVLVGERTRRASEAAIAYDDAGEHELKGKAEPVPLWRAERVIAARRGEGRATGLEAPFVGREGELRLVKDLFHATSDERRARLVSIVGIAGIGKTRLSSEFERTSTGSSTTSSGTAAAAWPTATAWPTGPSRRWCACAPGSPSRRTPTRRPPSYARRWSSTCPTPRNAAGSSNGWHSCSESPSRPPSTVTTCSPPGGCSSSGWPSATRRCSCSRTCSGPIQRCSTSSATCWTGREAIRSSCSRWHGPTSRRSTPRGRARSATSPRWHWSRSAARR